MKTFYWHDYETWGTIPSQDKPSQFAGVRTDEELNIIEEPLTLFCQPARDMLPHPEACLVTGITPQQALAQGVPEYEFMAQVYQQLARAGTCGVGYNTLRFDDEVTRYGLFRNFYDPYEREWKHGNSRWDIIDMVRLTRAIRPEGIEWPTREDGKPSFKLEHLTAANGLSHESAHDALSDVYATIDMAKLIRTKQPALFDYVYNLRSKHAVSKMIDVSKRKPLLHISAMFPAERGCAALVAPVAMHPTNKNSVIVFDLSTDPRPLLQLSSDEIRARVFKPASAEAEAEPRIALKQLHLNKCPVVATPKLLDKRAAQRLSIDLNQCEQHWQQLSTSDLAGKVAAVFAEPNYAPKEDPEQMLYAGFFNDKDRSTMAAVRQASTQELAETTFSFNDKRLPELLFRYRARNFPNSLSAKEQGQWLEFCSQRLTDPNAGGSITLEVMLEKIAQLRAQPDTTTNQTQILDALEEYAAQLI